MDTVLETSHGVIAKEKCVSKRIVQVLAKIYLASDGFQLSDGATSDTQALSLRGHSQYASYSSPPSL